MEISIGSDHAGFQLKESLKDLLESFQHTVFDEGTSAEESTDYPDFAARVAQSVSEGRVQRGILVCGTGIGMSIVANKFPGVRAALCHSLETARMSRQHNDSNVLALGSRLLSRDLALTIAAEWLKTHFDGGRHQRRVDKISAVEGSKWRA